MTATAAVLASTRLLPLVDRADFRTLFVEELGWDNPDQPPRTITVEGADYTLRQVAGYKGMRIWHCPQLPGRRTQRAIDQAVAKDNLERLVIFTGDIQQEWRWPRRAQTGGVNAKLLVHQHIVGEDDKHLVDQLTAIAIDFDDDPSLVEVLAKMRSAFDIEAEAASVAAARLMNRLYTDLEKSKVNGHDATLLLARLLFLLFGDDSGMWRTNMFRDYLVNHTSEATLQRDLTDLFNVLNTAERDRTLPEGSPFAEFRYVNGGLYRDELVLPPLKEDFRDGLLAACDFDWSLISPAIFGSMFQVVKDKEARREGGEHYTTEENILKTINPLFLDELHDRLEQAWDDKRQLTRLHNDLGRLQIMDPACGCGNFLIVSYRELRALELEILKRRRDLDEADGKTSGQQRYLGQMTLDVSGDIKVTLDHFYGLEIEEWPARIAETAMLLVDHLANQAMEEEFGIAPDRLPIKVAPRIVHDNALRRDWKHVVPPSPDVVIVGNPPFLGPHSRSAEQLEELQDVWGRSDLGRLDYVTGWHAKALDYFRNVEGRWAFVTTNSIVQGDQVPRLFGAIFNAGWRIKFAHRTFAWTSEATGEAAVHCVIIGYTRGKVAPRLFEYPNIKGPAHEVPAKNVNAYLVDGPDVLVEKRSDPLAPDLAPVALGSMPKDGGNLVVEAEDYDRVMADPIAAKYVHPYRGTTELLKGVDRWCLWLDGVDEAEIASSPVLRERVAAVRAFRLASRAPSTRKFARISHLFTQRAKRDRRYLCVPRVISENRPFFTADWLPPEVITSDSAFTVDDPDAFQFSVISSSMFLTWQKTVGGRLKSDLRFGSTMVWNTLPLPLLGAGVREEIIAAGQGVLDARALHPERSLVDHYRPSGMAEELVNAHAVLDDVVDRAFGATKKEMSERERQAVLFVRYQKMTANLLSAKRRQHRR
ncbi:class I SAM-dependent DNA methyltransferase [Georgenia sp. AZ-5]|uniref:class I SAM-dependent DNA methyltransferase n=1 Tax=Georgenia sp. AZ-5 TaxID=3367526 RepID=UPI0037545B50